ncbi:glutamate ligase domain-containing protein [Weissella cibaria]|uniref:glutamate ligase domain-containing protein n=1 Tax=Weissella cibaria TaxID=137591 RepID=UPI0039A76A11
MVAVTPISLDHMQWLGDTLEAIATNKAAVIQPGSRVVSAQQEPRVTAILQHATQQAQATWQAIDVPVEILVDTPAQLRLQIAGAPYELGLRGQMQAENVRLVWQILARLDLPTTPENRQLGLSQATLFGRLTVTGQVIYDGAHNPAGAQQLANELDRWGLRGHVILILGMLADKDTTAIQAALTPLARQVIGVTADNQRAMLATDIAQHTATLGEAMTQAKQLATATDWIVVAGSFYTIKGVITHGDLASEHDAFI